MLTKIKVFLKRILPPPTRTFFIIIDELAEKLLRKGEQILCAVWEGFAKSAKSSELKQIDANLAQMIAHQQQIDASIVKLMEHQQKQQGLLEQLISENRALNAQLQCVEKNIIAQENQFFKETEKQTSMLRKMLWACIFTSTSSSVRSWKIFAEKLPQHCSVLAFLKPLYCLHDALTVANVMDISRKDYVNTALAVCMDFLHSEQDPEDRQLIYDALKNEVFDGLELTGYEASFYSNQADYQEMQKIISRAYDYSYFSILSRTFYEQALIKWFRIKTGQELHLDNPVTYNEKIQWMKLYHSTPIKSQLSDKYAVRGWVAEKIGREYLVPLLGVWDNFDDIDFAKLPNCFVLKMTHGSGWNLVVHDKSKLDISEAKQKFDEWMGMNFAYRVGLELQYLTIPPRIIAEEYLENSSQDLYDYKVFCFDGKADSIMFLSNRKQGLRMAFYDLEWNKLSYAYDHPINEQNIPKPACLKELISLSEKLAEGFPHVRVDFYVLNDGTIKFGEMTFSSASGICRWNPPDQNEIFGNLIKLPEKYPYPNKE